MMRAVMAAPERQNCNFGSGEWSRTGALGRAGGGTGGRQRHTVNDANSM